MTETDPDDARGAATVPPASKRNAAGTPGATVGIGSALAIGCVVVFVVLVAVALAVRLLTDIW